MSLFCPSHKALGFIAQMTQMVCTMANDQYNQRKEHIMTIKYERLMVSKSLPTNCQPFQNFPPPAWENQYQHWSYRLIFQPSYYISHKNARYTPKAPEKQKINKVISNFNQINFVTKQSTNQLTMNNTSCPNGDATITPNGPQEQHTNPNAYGAVRLADLSEQHAIDNNSNINNTVNNNVNINNNNAQAAPPRCTINTLGDANHKTNTLWGEVQRGFSVWSNLTKRERGRKYAFVLVVVVLWVIAVCMGVTTTTMRNNIDNASSAVQECVGMTWGKYWGTMALQQQSSKILDVVPTLATAVDEAAAAVETPEIVKTPAATQ